MASANSKRVAKKEGVDLYNTPIEALEGIQGEYQAFNNWDTYYDPCSGLGKISEYLKNLGKKVYTSDIVDYGHQDNIEDFLKIEFIPEDVECIVFNPPFLLTKEFVDHAVQLCNKSKNCNSILMFNRLNTLESKYRASKFKSNEWPLIYCYVFGYRVSCTEGVEEKPTANSTAYAWFEFNTRHEMTPELLWITK